jgi:hypothetical protein
MGRRGRRMHGAGGGDRRGGQRGVGTHAQRRLRDRIVNIGPAGLAGPDGRGLWPPARPRVTAAARAGRDAGGRVRKHRTGCLFGDRGPNPPILREPYRDCDCRGVLGGLAFPGGGVGQHQSRELGRFGLAVIDTVTFTSRVVARGQIYGASFARDRSDRIAFASARSAALAARSTSA